MARTRGAAKLFSVADDPSLPPSAQIPRPGPDDVLDWPRWFDVARPVEVDIGCGLGRFLLARSQAFPETQFLGIERELARVLKIDVAVRRGGIPNIRLLRADALESVVRLLPPASVSAAYVFFPDPWPKRRHRKRRLFSAEFLDGVHRILKPGAGLHVATDQPEYFQDMRKRLDADPRFAVTAPFTRAPEEQTDFELIFRAKGLPVGEASYLKIGP